MADNVTAPAPDGTLFAFDEVTIDGALVKAARGKLGFGTGGSYTEVSSADPLPVAIGAGPFAITGGLTDAQLRASALPVSLSGSVAVTGPLTDAQLRATAVPVSGTVGVSGSVAVTGPLTDTQLRATALPVSAASLPLPAGAATNATVATLLTESTFTTRQPTTGPKAASGSVPMVLSNDQDPVLDHANAVIAAITNASSTAITPPAGSRYGVFTPTVDMFVRTDGVAASASAAGSLKLFANVPRDLPIVGGTAVTAIVASGTGELRITPSKSRT